MLRIGIQSDVYERAGRTREEALALMSRHGYERLDYQGLAQTDGEIFQLEGREFERRLLEDKALAESFGLSYGQTHAPYWQPQETIEPEERAARLAAVEKAFRGTAIIGAPVCVVHANLTYGDESPAHRDELWEADRAFFDRLCDTADACGVTIGYENLPYVGLPLSRSCEILRFTREIGRPRMKICLDTGHAAVYGDSPADVARAFGKDLLACLHVHDNDGRLDRHMLPGAGVIDWSDFSAALGEIGYEGDVSMETGVLGDFPPAEREERERAAADYLKKIALGRRF